MRVKNNVKITIYDLSGRIVRALIDEYVGKGKHAIVWNGMNLRGEKTVPGVYFYKIQTGKSTQTHKMIKL